MSQNGLLFINNTVPLVRLMYIPSMYIHSKNIINRNNKKISTESMIQHQKTKLLKINQHNKTRIIEQCSFISKN